MQLRDPLVVQQLLQSIEYSDSLFEKLPKGLLSKETWVFREFNRVRIALYHRVKNFKYNNLQGILLHHLLEIMPMTEAQRKVLPVLEIDIGDNFSLNLHTQVRTCRNKM